MADNRTKTFKIESGIPIRPPNVGRKSFESDASLIEEAIQGVDTERYDSEHEAAQDLADRAEGYGIRQSTVTRLCRGISKKRRPSS